MKRSLLKHVTMLLASAALAAVSTDASTLFLPNPSGSQVLAGWVPTGATLDSDGKMEDANGPWVWTGGTITDIAAAYSNGSATYKFVSSLPSGSPMLNSAFSIGTGMPGGGATSATMSLQTTDYSGPAISRLSLTLAVNYLGEDTRGTDAVLQGALTIGGVSYSSADATFTTDRDFLGKDTVGRYEGVFGSIALVTYEWDLEELGFAGSYSDFILSWNFDKSASFLYDAQINAVVVPEPATWALILGAAISVVVCVRRRKGARG